MRSTSESSARSQDDPIAKKLEETVNRLAVAEEKNRLLDDRIEAKQATIEAKDLQIAELKKALAAAEKMDQKQIQVNTGDARMLSACESQLAKAEARIFSLEHPGLLRSIFDFRTLTGAAAGYAFGRMTK